MNRRSLLFGASAAFIPALAKECKATDGSVLTTGINNVQENSDELRGGVGDLIEGDDLHLVIEDVSTTTKIGEFTEADAGNELLVVRLAYKNITNEFHSVSGLLRTRVRDDDDYSYDQSLLGTEQALNDGEIAPGEVERGEVVYEVPQDATGFVLEFDFESGLFGDLERAVIDLEQESNDPYVLEQELAVNVYGIGDAVEHEGTTVRVNEINTATELDQFTVADEGYKYVIVDVTVANDTGEEQTVSTVLQMQLKDGNGFSYNEDLGGSVALDRAFDEGAPIADGNQRRGQLAYEVEEGIEPLYWIFEFALFAEGNKTFWQIR